MIGFDNLAISVGKVLMCVLKGRNPVVPGKWRSGAGPSVMAGPDSVPLRQAKSGLWGTRYGLGQQVRPGDRGCGTWSSPGPARRHPVGWGPCPGPCRGAVQVWLQLRPGRAAELQLEGSSRRQGAACAGASPRSCLAAPTERRRSCPQLRHRKAGAQPSPNPRRGTQPGPVQTFKVLRCCCPFFFAS